MAWLVLLASAVLEAIWATALGQSDGFSRMGPTTVFAISFGLSMAGLGWAVRRIPIGTAYAVWTGVGAALTVGIALLTGQESASVLKLVFLAGIIAAVAGLKLVSAETLAEDTQQAPERQLVSSSPRASAS
ncbi:DMT family transporter [Mycolicibacterium confluentis]|uniref:QacE family quaternary ammonium compound efflux SMR transporter n=1 Tax=Mycolicibacterium confluentis TaxID=28047 RepID=A0A7I7XSF6_9MYCO|nr:multidrug efflux SMR transporter [Mycolicibacterium confluentis]MCV7321303.1 multidrug efflux SMR transporter [Mycolicibacterium confluentis]ORV25225.1 ligand-binding protein SH3 [Mycolicibacterium confluentis]BBZ32217.1 QacE family quaternary ammonium compound efflux SMR transporter [Mycolicibacterium confluentis]